MKRIFCLILAFVMLTGCAAALGEGQLQTGKFWNFSAHSGLLWVLRRDVSMVQVYTEAGDLISEFDPGFDLMHTQVYAESDHAYFVADDGVSQRIVQIDMDGNIAAEWAIPADMHIRQVEPMDAELLLIVDKEIENRYGDTDGLYNYGFFELYSMTRDGTMEPVGSMPEIGWVQYNGQYIVGVDSVQGNVYVMDAESRDIETEMCIQDLYCIELFGDNTGVYLINGINDPSEFPAIYGVIDIDSGDMTELARIPAAANAQAMSATENSIFHAFWTDEALNTIEIPLE